MGRAIAIPFPVHAAPAQGPAVSQTPPIPGSAVRPELARILASEGFVHAERMRRFLTFIVEETLAGRAKQLCEYSIAIWVFDREESFEPGLNPIVRNDARRLRQKLLEYYQQRISMNSEYVFIEIPKGGYVPVFSMQSREKPAQIESEYRFSAKLIRVADGARVWAIERTIRLE